MYNLKITSDQGKDDTSSNRTSSSKPTGTPRTDKDFRKILGDKDDRQNDENDDPKNAQALGPGDSAVFEEIAYNEKTKKQKQPSLFDLSKSKVKKDGDDEASDVAKMASADELPTESSNSIFRNLALKEKAGQSKGAEDLELAGKMGDIDEHKDKITSRFSQDSMDLSFVNPLALNNTTVAEIGDQKLGQATSSQRLTMQQLVDAVVKAIATVEAEGKTDTIVTLTHPPMFAGANIVLTSYETAKGEFNIRFENLTQQAKSFMDMQQNQDSLLSTLQQKGYAVHIVVATTQTETPHLTPNPQQTREDNPDQQQQQEQERRRQQDEEA